VEAMDKTFFKTKELKMKVHQSFRRGFYLPFKSFVFLGFMTILLCTSANATVLSTDAKPSKIGDRPTNRDVALMGPNLTLGFCPSLIMFLSLPPATPADTNAFQILPSLGVAFGYRTHFLSQLGIKAELQGFSGPTWINLDGDTSATDTVTWKSFSGGKGTTSGISYSGQIMLGPFHGMVFEPGLGFTSVWRSASKLELRKGTSTRTIQIPAQQNLFNVILGFGVLVGDRNQFNLTGIIKPGWDLGPDPSPTYQLQGNMAYAFRPLF
jgi:hypothetical protein